MAAPDSIVKATVLGGTEVIVLPSGEIVVQVVLGQGNGTGDVIGPAGAVNNRVAFFNGATGKVIKDSGLTLAGTNTGDVTLGTPSGLSLAGQVLSLGVASAGVTGALSGADWSAFNAKQGAGSYLTGLTGDVTAAGPGAAAATIANSAVTLSKIALASANSRLLGSGAAGSGSHYAELTLGTGLSMSGTTLNAATTGGTVTSVSVTTSDGVVASVANPTIAPIIAIGLGDITPNSVNADGTVLGSNLSGTNTGDQTNISGNAGTATALQNARTINGVSFNGTGNITVPAAAGTLTGATMAAGVTASSLTSVGTLVGGATGAGFTLALGTSTLSGDLPYANLTPSSAASRLLGRTSASAGDWQEITLGTNLSMSGTTLNATGGGGSGNVTAAGNLTSGIIVLGTGTTGVEVMGDRGTNVQVLHGSAAGVPTFGPVNLTADVSDTLPFTHGGTGQITAQLAIDSLMAASGTLLQGDIFHVNASGNVIRLAAGSAGEFLKTLGGGADPMWAAAVGDVVNDPNWAAKGDLVVGTGTDTASILSVGTNGFMLSADSGEATGLKWIAAGSGSGDVVGPASSTDGAWALYDGTTGKLLKDGVVPSATAVGLGNVTNDAQTFATVVPNTLPSSGQVLVGNMSGDAYTAQTMTGDATINNVAALTVTSFTVADEATDPTCFPLFATAAAGSLGPKSNINLTFNSSTGVLSALLGSSTATTQSPGDNSDKLATTAFVYAALADFDLKDPVVCATTTALLFTPSYSNGSSGVGATLTGSVGTLIIDGYTPALNERILVKNEASTLTQGVYKLTTLGTISVGYVLTRATDFNQAANILYGDSVGVLQGTANANQQFTMNNQNAITVGTTAITFAQSSGGSQLTSGTGITITGNSIAVSTVPVANGGTNLTSYAVGDILYASGTTTLSKLADVATGSVLISGGVTTAPAWSTTPTFTGTNISGTGASFTSGITQALKSATTTVDVSAATAPSTGQVLTATDSMHATWQAASAGSLVLLEQHTASSSASLDFSTCISSTYDEYAIEFVNVVPATDSVNLLMRMSTDGGSTYSTSAVYSYDYLVQSLTAVAGSGATGQTSITVCNNINNTASWSMNGDMKLYNPGSSIYKSVIFQSRAMAASARYNFTGGGSFESTTAVNAFRFLFSSGNIASGTIRVYGIAK